MKIILIAGKQGAGKTTLADELQRRLEALGRQVLRRKFAEPLYVMHDAIRKVAADYGIDWPAGGIDGPLLQLLGTDWGRKSKGDDVWVRTLQRQLESRELPDDAVVIIDDLRFPNELMQDVPDAIRVRLHAPQSVRRRRAAKWRDEVNHPSETALDMIDTRNGTFDHELDSDFVSSVACADYLIARSFPRRAPKPVSDLAVDLLRWSDGVVTVSNSYRSVAHMGEFAPHVVGRKTVELVTTWDEED